MDKAKILIVEDEVIIGMDLSVMLQEMGFARPHLVTSGEEALRVLPEIKPDIVLMDILLAGAMDGIEAALVIREKYALPVVFITGNADMATVRRARECGPYGYIMKPVYVQHLYSTLDTALERFNLENRLRDKSEELQATNEELQAAMEEMETANEELSSAMEELETTNSELLRTQEELIRSEEKFSRSFHSSVVGMGIFTLPEGRCMDINDLLLDMIALRREEIVGRKVPELGLWARSEQRGKVIDEIRAKGQVRGIELEMKVEGRIKTFLVSAEKEMIGGQDCMIVSVTDITERKRMEAELREARRQAAGERDLARRYIDIAGVMLIVIGADETVQLINRRGGEILEAPPEEIIGSNWFERFVPEALRDQVRGVFRGLMQGEVTPVEYYENEVLTARGNLRRVAWHNTILKDGNGGITGTLSSGEDLTQYARVQEDLTLFKAVIENSQEAIVISDSEGRLVYINPAHEALFGRTLEEARNINYRDYYPPESVEILDREVAPALAAGRNWEGEMDVFDAAGRRFPLWERAGALMDGSGHMRYAFGFMHDISRRKEAEAAMKESEEKYRALVENSNSIILIFKRGGEITFLNEYGLRFFGYSPDEILGRSIVGTIVPETEAGGRDLASLMDDLFVHPDKYQNNVNENTKKDGSRVWIAWTNRVIRDEAGRPAEMFSVGSDITELKTMEEQIKASLQEKETLIREIHHRVKNNMQIIISLLNIQSQKVHDADMVREFADAKRRIRSMALVHEKLYNSADFNRIELASYVRDLAAELLMGFMNPEDRPALLMDAEKLFLSIEKAVPCGLIINELVTNVLKYAFPAGWEGKREIRIAVSRQGEGRAELAVSDNGAGMPEGVDMNAAGSFGLQLVAMLIRQLGGTVRMESSPGTRFDISFPVD